MKALLSAAIIAIAAISASAQSTLKAGSPAPQFSATSIDGRSYDLQEMAGKVVLLTFWSTRCQICRSEIPKLNALAGRYDGRNVEMLGLSTEGSERIDLYLKSNPFKFHILPDSFGVMLQYANRDRSGNIDMGFPAYFLIDASGKIAYRGSGWDRIDELTARIDALVNSSARSLAP